MQLSNRSREEYQWQAYKQLELLPASLQNRSVNIPKSRLGLKMIWRSLICLLVDELVDQEQQVEYLERCWTSESENQSHSPTTTLQRLWALMN
ncbi:MAG: hypothetical protein JOZ78_17850 [Chroococcidiopsidaceae cyanobacterium CP_BM_ER_R8_30]|nr:hypothetical protein [Chroococcidiopsidaceae cyanobacterium CP_BM_ER_R8_30]